MQGQNYFYNDKKPLFFILVFVICPNGTKTIEGKSAGALAQISAVTANGMRSCCILNCCALTVHLRKLAKEEQMKPRLSTRKVMLSI